MKILIQTSGLRSGRIFGENKEHEALINLLEWNIKEIVMNGLEENITNSEEPTTFEEAWDHPNDEERKKWREAIKKEMLDAINKGVYKRIKKKDVPKDKRYIKNGYSKSKRMEDIEQDQQHVDTVKYQEQILKKHSAQ